MTVRRPEQLPLALPVRPALGREDFLVAGPNARAVAALDTWREWPQGKFALAGPEGAGKSHLLAVWAAETGAVALDGAALPDPGGVAPRAVAVDGADAVAGVPEAERRLLHLHNRVLGADGRLLLAARTPPARWPAVLPDLASRLAATPVARIEPPDDALLAAVLVKLFHDRQLAVSSELVGWLVPRMERSFAAADRLVAALDARALAGRRPLTRPLAREVLEEDAARTDDATLPGDARIAEP